MIVDGECALDRLSESSFELIILGIMVPGINGLTVLENTRKAGTGAHVLMPAAKGDIEYSITLPVTAAGPIASLFFSDPVRWFVLSMRSDSE